MRRVFLGLAVLAVATIGVAAILRTNAGDGRHAKPQTASATLPPASAATAVGAAVAAASPPSLRRVSFPPGSPVPLEHGVYVIDPATGFVQGWARPDPMPVVGQLYPPDSFEISSGGRYVVYGDWERVARLAPGEQLPPIRWRLLDTFTSTVRDLPLPPPSDVKGDYGFVSIVFSPNEQRYAAATADGVTVRRTSDDAVERVFTFDWDEHSRLSLRDAWSADSQTLVVRAARNAPPGPYRARLLRLSLRSGEMAVLAEGDVALGRWAPDGRRYVARIDDADLVYDAATDTPAPLLRSDWSPSPDFPASGLSVGTPNLTPDGLTIVVPVAGTPDGDGRSAARVYVLDAASGAPRFWIENTRCDGGITADGRWLLVEGTRQGELGRYLVATDGSEIRLLAGSSVLLSPRDAHAAVMPIAEGLRFLNVPDGSERLTVSFAGPRAYSAYHRHRWLTDGRLAVIVTNPLQIDCFTVPEDDIVIRFPG